MYNTITQLYSRDWHIINQVYIHLKNNMKRRYTYV